jgi:hypothetical protein
MRIRAICLIAMLMIFGTASAVFAQTASFSIDSLGFMAGCWASAPGKRSQTNEQWMRPAGGLMMGMARTVAGGKAVDHEVMRIEKRGADIFFIARPKANKEDTEFKLTTLTPTEAVFENPAHDFPQRVIYRLAKDGSLAPRIEGTVNGKAKGIDFPMIRANCDK